MRVCTGWGTNKGVLQVIRCVQNMMLSFSSSASTGASEGVYLDELLHLVVLVFPAEDWSMSPPPTELAAPSEVDRCSPNGLAPPHMLSPPDAAWPAPGKSSSPEPPSFGPGRTMPAATRPLD